MSGMTSCFFLKMPTVWLRVHSLSISDLNQWDLYQRPSWCCITECPLKEIPSIHLCQVSPQRQGPLLGENIRDLGSKTLYDLLAAIPTYTQLFKHILTQAQYGVNNTGRAQTENNEIVKAKLNLHLNGNCLGRNTSCTFSKMYVLDVDQKQTTRMSENKRCDQSAVKQTHKQKPTLWSESQSE